MLVNLWSKLGIWLSMIVVGLISACGDNRVARNRVEDKLKDPSSAQYKNVVSYSGGVVCGEVNAKNSMGGYVGFESFVFKEGEVNLKPTFEEEQIWCNNEVHTQAAHRQRKLLELDNRCKLEKSLYGDDQTRGYSCKEASDTRALLATEAENEEAEKRILKALTKKGFIEPGVDSISLIKDRACAEVAGNLFAKARLANDTSEQMQVIEKLGGCTEVQYLEQLRKDAYLEIDPAEITTYNKKGCEDLKKMARSYPNSIYAERIESYMSKRWGSACK